MPAARDLTLDEHGVKRGSIYVLTVGVSPNGGIFIVGDIFTRFDPDAADHIAALLRQHAENERVVETARLICAEVAR
jgi:hypothetical protein